MKVHVPFYLTLDMFKPQTHVIFFTDVKEYASCYKVATEKFKHTNWKTNRPNWHKIEKLKENYTGKHKMHLSFCSQVSILPGIELSRSDVNLLNVVWAIHGSPMFIILAIVMINFQFTPRCRSNFTGRVEPSWSMLQALRLFNSFFSSLSLLQSANTWTQSNSKLWFHHHLPAQTKWQLQIWRARNDNGLHLTSKESEK